MRHFCSLVLAGLLVASVASAQGTPTAPGAKPPAPSTAVATGSVENSANGSASGAASEQPAPAEVAPAKPARRVARKAKKRKFIKGPIAGFPAFHIQPDGSSRVHVNVSEKVIVTERKAEGRISYRLKGASVPVRTNLLALETSFFRTPVARVMLVEVDDEDVELVIELRQPSASTYKVVDTDAGMILQVDFPAPTTQAPAPPRAK